jgi:hypothetical protein
MTQSPLETGVVPTEQKAVDAKLEEQRQMRAVLVE